MKFLGTLWDVHLLTISLLLLSWIVVSRADKFKICDESIWYEYDMDECPGGLQIRDVNRWFSNTRDKTCISGDGAMLQFNGKTEEWFEYIYPHGFPNKVIPILGSWHDYHLQPTWELLQGSDPSVLFISGKKYENPANFPTRAIDLMVEEFEPERVVGNYKIAFTAGKNRRTEIKLWHFLRTVMFNTQDPVLIVEDPKVEFKSFQCAYNSTAPEVILSKYVTTDWGNQDLAESCEKKLYPPYNRTRYICPVSCASSKQYVPPPPSPEKDQPQQGFRKMMQTMMEIAIRLKYTGKFVKFGQLDQPYVAVLQNTARVFFRAFPNVVRWETLMSATALFGIAFEGLIPSEMKEGVFDQLKIMLGRCSIQEMRKEKEYSRLFTDLCPSIKNAVSQELNNSLANLNSGFSSVKRKRAGPPPAPSGSGASQKVRVSFGGDHNVVIDLLWKLVQFAHATCISSSDHFPNIHHFYTTAMIEMFSAPAVQLLWFQQAKYDYRQLGKVMIHIFPELPAHVLPTMDKILGKMKFETHFNVLQRPKIKDLDTRDMRCGGMGKIIWGGRACCYQRSDDNKFYFFKKVAFAKL